MPEFAAVPAPGGAHRLRQALWRRRPATVACLVGTAAVLVVAGPVAEARGAPPGPVEAPGRHGSEAAG